MLRQCSVVATQNEKASVRVAMCRSHVEGAVYWRACACGCPHVRACACRPGGPLRQRPSALCPDACPQRSSPRSVRHRGKLYHIVRGGVVAPGTGRAGARRGVDNERLLFKDWRPARPSPRVCVTTWVPPQGEVPENPRAMAASPHAVRDEGGLLCPFFLLEPSALSILVAAKHRSG
jgi:hypothetical protein